MGSEKKFTVPDIGDFEEVDVIEVLVSPGDRIRVDQSLVTLESDKATMELPSPYAGVVREIHVAVGDKVSQGSLLMTLDDVTGGAEPAPERVPVERRPAARGVPADAPEPIATQPPPPARAAHASPSVRRLAQELGVDLARVKGTGPKDRILRDDVQEYVKSSLAAVPAPGGGGGGFALPELPQVDFSKFGEVELQPLNRIRRISGRNLHRSWITVPHVTQFDEADVTDLEEFRKSKLTEGRERGVKLTILVFLMKALEVTLKDFPQFNSSLDRGGDALVIKKYFHIGVAVDTENGLVVPVIRDVNRKGLLDLATELTDVSQRARDRKLTPEDLSGGCITISSLGGIGGTAFTPIVNAPEVAVLGVSRAQIKPVYRDGEFVPRLMLPLSLSYDHRVIDGADAVRFTVRLKTVLSDIRNLIL